MKPLKVALIGEVDAGKSTTLGQLLIRTGSVKKTKWLEIERASKELKKEFEPAFLLDAFEYERQNEMTVDVTSTYCRWWGEELHFLDTPGHQELSNKFLGGAADCDFALLILDSTRALESTHFRHLRCLTQLGLLRYGILINKIEHNESEKFSQFSEKLKTFLRDQVEPVFVLPVDAKSGRGFDQELPYPWFEKKYFLEILRQALKFSGPPETTRIISAGKGFIRLESGHLSEGKQWIMGQDPVEVVIPAGQHLAPKILKVNLPEGQYGRMNELEPISGKEHICQFVNFEQALENVQVAQFKFGSFAVKASYLQQGTIRLQFEKDITIFQSKTDPNFYRQNIFVLRSSEKIIGVGVPL